MDNTDKKYKAYIDILHEELIPAMGCTEPIAIAYAAARAREVLGSLPDHVLIEASDNIIKNVKSVVVPNTGNVLKPQPLPGLLPAMPVKFLRLSRRWMKKGKKKLKPFLKARR